MTKAIAAVLPWAPRRERQHAIQAARREKERSQQAAAHAKRVERDIRALYQQNHWAATIAHELGIDRQRGKGEK